MKTTILKPLRRLFWALVTAADDIRRVLVRTGQMLGRLKYTPNYYAKDGLKGVGRYWIALPLREFRHAYGRMGRTRFFCPCCGWRGANFMPYIDPYYVVFQGECPSCYAQARHRGHALFYRERLKVQEWRGKLLYFASEFNIKQFKENPAMDVKTSEYGDKPADFHYDLLHIDGMDNTWDYIVCHHVIEHVADDRKAMRELYRILKPGGLLVMSVPITRDRATTVEFGRPNPFETDHYYNYGMDFETRIPNQFHMEKMDFSKMFTPAQMQQSLLGEDFIFLCKKPGSDPVPA